MLPWDSEVPPFHICDQAIVLLGEFTRYKAFPYTLFHGNPLELGVVGQPFREESQWCYCVLSEVIAPVEVELELQLHLHPRALLCPPHLAACFRSFPCTIPHDRALEM